MLPNDALVCLPLVGNVHNLAYRNSKETPGVERKSGVGEKGPVQMMLQVKVNAILTVVTCSLWTCIAIASSYYTNLMLNNTNLEIDTKKIQQKDRM